LLNLLAGRGLSHRFDGGYRLIAYRTDGQHTGPDRLAVQVDSTRPTLRDTAPEFGSRQADNIPQNPEHGHIGGYID
jgi:hypothetical protein